MDLQGTQHEGEDCNEYAHNWVLRHYSNEILVSIHDLLGQCIMKLVTYCIKQAP
jgi:hypothetical protein